MKMRGNVRLTRLQAAAVLAGLLLSIVARVASGQSCPGQWLPSGDVLAGLNGPVWAMVEWDPDGAGPLAPVLVVGGSFTVAADRTVSNIVTWDGSHWASLGTGVNGIVYALAVAPNNDLIVAGAFTTAGGAPANRIAWWNGATWSAYGGGLDGVVRSVLPLPNGDVIAGGAFTQGGSANRIARWNGSAWTGLGAGMGPSSVNALLAMPNGDIIAGGDFGTAGGVTVNEIARWNGSAWSALGGGMMPVGFGGVHSLLLMPNGDIMAGGQFFTADGILVYGVARWNGAAWSNLRSGVYQEGQGGSWNGDVRSLVLLPNGDVVVGGYFVSAGGVPTGGVARWDGSDWFAYSPTSPHPNALLRRANGDLVAAAGNVVSIWNGTQWASLDGEASSFVDGNVTVLTALADGGFVAAGAFTHIGGVAMSQIARWNHESWSPLGVGMYPGSVAKAIVQLPNGDIVVGGNFGIIGGIDAFNIGGWNGTNWYALGSGLNGGVNALAVLPNGNLVAAGGFSTAGGVAANRLAIWDGTAWSAFGTGPSGAGGDILCMVAMPNGDLFVGGTFTSINGVPANRFARWDGSVWQALSSGMNNAVVHLAAFHNDVVAQGQFTMAGGWPVQGAARWNGADYSAAPGSTDTQAVLATQANGDLLFATGLDSNLWRWDGTATTIVGTPSGDTPGASYIVYAVAELTSGDIVAGGGFSRMNGKPAMHFARKAPPSADFNHDGDTGTDQDINDFFSCLAGNCCPLCSSADFNNDGDVGTDADIESFFRVLGGGPC